MKYRLYHGSSSYLSLEVAYSYIDKLHSKDPALSLLSLEADSLPAQNIIDIISSPSLFQEKRILFIKRIWKNKERVILLEKILEILSEGIITDHLLFWEDQKIKANTKYYKFFKEKEYIEEIPELNKRTFFSWLRKELEKNNLKIDQTNIKELAERTNYDPERCKNEIIKFKLNNPNGIITKEDIHTLTVDSLEKEIWDLIDAINERDTEKSIQILEKLFLQTIDPNYILSMLARNLRLILLANFLIQQGKTSRDISSILKIPPFTTPALIKAGGKYDNEKIRFIYKKLSNLDLQIKTGKIDGNLGLSILCPYL